MSDATGAPNAGGLALKLTALGGGNGAFTRDERYGSRKTSAPPPEPPPPGTGNDSVVPFLEGLAAIEDHMVMVLNLVALTGGVQLAEAA
jgi:purine-binding chemotaxis protein CheW